MKRKLYAWMFVLNCAFFLTACNGSEEVMNNLGTQEEQFAQESDSDKTLAADLPEEEDETSDAEESREPEEGAPEEDETVSAPNMPDKLSDNLYDFQVSVDGMVYQFPMWYSDFEALGWEYSGNNSDTLANNRYVASQQWTRDGVCVGTEFANLSVNTVSFSDSMVGGIHLERRQMKDCGWKILLPGGIEWGVSNTEDIKAVYGSPSSDYDGSSYYKMTYQNDAYCRVDLYVYKDTGVLEEIYIENLVELPGADNSVSDEVPDVIKNYETPSALGDDLYSFHVELEGNLYKLPCPVTEFLANGFTIVEDGSDMEMASGSSRQVYLRYNDQEIYATAKNYADYATTLENCMLISLGSSDFDFVIPGNIKRGDSEADVGKAIEGYHVEVMSDNGYTSYTIYNPDDTWTNQYTVIVKDGLVVSIDIRNDEWFDAKPLIITTD